LEAEFALGRVALEVAAQCRALAPGATMVFMLPIMI